MDARLGVLIDFALSDTAKSVWDQITTSQDTANKRMADSDSKRAKTEEELLAKRKQEEEAAATLAVEEVEKKRQASISANLAIQEAAARRVKIEQEYQNAATSTVLQDYERLIKESQAMNQAMKDSTDKRVKAEIAEQKKEVDEAKQVLSSIAKAREEVVNEGAGAHLGLLGLGRNFLNIGPLKESLDQAQAAQKEADQKILATYREYDAKIAEAQQQASQRELELIKEYDAKIVAAKDEEARKILTAEKESNVQLASAKEAEAKREIEITREKMLAEQREVVAGLEKEVNETKSKLKGIEEAQHKVKESAHEMGLGMVAGAAAGVISVGGLFELGIEEQKNVGALRVGFANAGIAAGEMKEKLNENEESTKELSEKYVVNKEKLDQMTATYLKAGGPMDNLKARQEQIMAIAQHSGKSLEESATAFALSSQGNTKALDKMYPALKGVTDQNERMAILQKANAGAMNELAAQANDPIKQFENFTNEMKTTGASVGSLMFNFISPLFSILSKGASFIQTVMSPAIEGMSGPLGTVLRVVGALAIAFVAYNVIMEANLVKTTLLTIKTGLQAAADTAWTIAKGAWNAIQLTGNGIMLAFNAIMDMNPIALVVVGVVAFVAILVVMYNKVQIVHDAINAVWGAIKKVIDVVASAGAAVLKLLGITHDQTEAEKAHTEQLEKEKKKMDDLRSSTDALAASQKDQVDTAKQAQDDTLVNLTQIDAKLKGKQKLAEGETIESLQRLRAQWVAYGKDASKTQDDISASQHGLAVEIGAAADNEKKAKDTTAKVAKDKYVELKRLEDNRFGEEKLALTNQLINKQITEDQFKQLELEKATEHQNKLLAIATDPKFSKLHHDDVLAINTQIANDTLTQFKTTEDRRLALEKEINTAESKAKIDAIKDTTVKAQTEESNRYAQVRADRAKDLADEKLGKQLSESLEREHLANLAAIDIEQGKKDAAIQGEIAKNEEQAKLDLIKDANKKAIAEEDLRYQHDLDSRKDDLNNTKLGMALRQSMEADHQNKLIAISRKAHDEQVATVSAAFGSIKNLAIANNVDRLKLADDFASKQFGIQNASMLKEQGGLKKFLIQNLATFAQNKLAELLVHTTTEEGKTAATETGVISRIAAGIAEVAGDVASAAASAFSAVANAIRWVSTIFPFPVNLALIPLAVAGVYEAYQGAKSLFKLADGAMLTGPTNFTAGQQAFQGGEAGQEAIVPLRKYPGMGTLMNKGLGLEEALQPVVDGLHAVKHAVYNAPPIMVDQKKNILSQHQTIAVERRTALPG